MKKVFLFFVAALAATVSAGRVWTAECGPATVYFDGKPAPPPSASVCGFSVIAADTGPQLALIGDKALLLSVRGSEAVCVSIPVRHTGGAIRAEVQAQLVSGSAAQVSLSAEGRAGPAMKFALRKAGEHQRLAIEMAGAGECAIKLETVANGGEALVRWEALRIAADGVSGEMSVLWPRFKEGPGSPPTLPELRESIERALIEWDWRMQDGIGTARAPGTYADAIARNLKRGDALIRDLRQSGVALDEDARTWEELRHCSPATEQERENMWRRVHELKRRIALRNPLADVGPLAFIKQVPAAFSHQLTQYYGRYARPGGGVFVLEKPGVSMRCRKLTSALPEGSCQHLDVSYKGDRILFAFCRAEAAPADGIQGHRGRYYHLYEVSADGAALRRLTDGPFDDFAPRHLPNGRIVFISTRRLGWHRCGNPGCENYTLALAEADGSNPRAVSYHETQEWDPAVLDDGRIVYTRWDYVDRHAVFYEHLWTVRPDGSAPAALYGNNTFNPVGTWEPRQVPGSRKVMATAAAHHAMTAGSIILVDPAKGVDGPGPITRLTPDAPFPESEIPVLKSWRAAVNVTPYNPVENQRWPGHCYRSPYPLSEKYFLAAYSFDALVGEPSPNPANMFGLYLVDAFGNKELLYRDLNIASLWPMPLRARPTPPVVTAGQPLQPAGKEGVFLLQNVYASAPPLNGVKIKRLRIVQVLPKSTPGANNPTVGVPNASPGKQVLGTVPVEEDGSACFHAPAGIPLSFQALDEEGMAVQVMRSVTYLQPGETAACVGCHESRTAAPPARRIGGPLQALARPPSPIEPGPDGSKPLSYPILVQPVLDKRCVSCHSGEKPAGGVALTGTPDGRYTTSYNALAPRVSFSAWGGKRKGDFREINSEPLSKPGFFGARGSPLLKTLLERPTCARLSREELERLVTWMDANALFYGTFDPADQARQQRGERIAGPKLE